MSDTTIGNLRSSTYVQRHPDNPILTSRDIPYLSDLIFNAGVTKYQDQYIMLFRNDYGTVDRLNTNLGLAFSHNGIDWSVEPEPVLAVSSDDIRSVNDPRINIVDDDIYVTYAIIAKSGVRGGIAKTEDFKTYNEIHQTLPDNRNLVLFPEKMNGHYVRLDRPFANYLRKNADSFDIWLSTSPDMIHWGQHHLLLKAEDVPFANNKIGPGCPPLKTDAGWLVIFHTVDVDSKNRKDGWEETWNKRYCAGVMLLDYENPTTIIGVSQTPLIVPEAPYETSEGFRNNVIFPCGAILEDDGEVKIYYGAADTVECLATAQVNDLINLCKINA